jgi:6-phosphogluconolactonase
MFKLSLVSSPIHSDALACLAFAVVVLLCGAGCNGFFVDESSDGGTSKHILYVINNNGGDTGSVSAFTIRSSGTLSRLSDDISTGGGPSSVAITSDNTYLYVGNTNGGISAYSIGGSGSLTALSDSPYSTGITPVSLTIESGGTYLYALDSSSSAISVFRISSSTGALTLIQTLYLSNVASVSGPLYSIRAAPHKKYLYVALGQDGIWVYKIGSSGNLTYTSTIPAPAGGQSAAITIDPDGTFAYVPDGNNSVWLYTIETTGTLTQISGATYVTGSAPVAAEIDSNGKYVIAANQDDNSVAAFTKTSDGSLSLVAKYSAGKSPSALAIDAAGKFVYVGNRNSANVSMFSIQDGGALANLGNATTGTEPVALVTTNY